MDWNKLTTFEQSLSGGTERLDALDLDGNEISLYIDPDGEDEQGNRVTQHSITWINFGYYISLTTDSVEHTRQLFEALKHTKIEDMD